MTITQMELLPSLDLTNMSENLRKAVLRLQEGRVILLLDAYERENEGDLIIAAEKITAESMNFLIKKGSGVVCLALPKKRLDFLGLPLMVNDNTNFFHTAFTVSIEAKSGVTTGVSAKDRAHTIQVAMADDAESSQLARPGHVFPLAARTNGVFERTGHTEGSVDLMRIAGLKPGAVLCELMNEDGSMTIGQNRVDFAQKFDIPVVSVEEVLCHRLRTEAVFERSTKKEIATRFGSLAWHSFRFFDQTTVDIFHSASADAMHGTKRIALVTGDNLPKRFMAQVLEQSDDDPLFGALTQMANDHTDCVVMTSRASAPNGSEQQGKTDAMICRALREIAVHSIQLNNTQSEFARIARDYFFLNIVK